MLREEREALLGKISAYDAAGIATLMIPGNHDFQNQDRTISAIGPYAHLSRLGKFKHSVITEQTQIVIRHGVGFILFCDPWAKLSSFLETLRTGSVSLGVEKLIVVSHETVKGSVTMTGIKLPKGTEVLGTPSDVTYVAFGDIHKRQKVCDRAYYSGSPYQINFGEANEQGVLLVDTEDSDNPKFLPIKSMPLLTVTSIRDIPEGSYARLEYADKPLEKGVLPESVVATKWTPDQVDLTNIVLDEHLLSGLEHVLKERGLSEDDIPFAMAEAEEVMRSLGDM